MTTQDALALYRKAESKTGVEGARKRWRMAAQALAAVCDDRDGQAAFLLATESHKRADWRNAARMLAKALGGAKERPAKPEPMPATLCEFLAASGGICDDGDFRAIGADLWHKAKPFRRRLIRPEGLSVDHACDLAFERGYFDHVPCPTWDGPDNMHPVSPDMLKAAIERELAGRPVYPNACENAPYVDASWDDEPLWNEAFPEYAEAA